MNKYSFEFDTNPNYSHRWIEFKKKVSLTKLLNFKAPKFNGENNSRDCQIRITIYSWGINEYEGVGLMIEGRTWGKRVSCLSPSTWEIPLSTVTFHPKSTDGRYLLAARNPGRSMYRMHGVNGNQAMTWWQIKLVGGANVLQSWLFVWWVPL